ncbi:MAG: alpha/beta hydrolase fold protein, partial [Marmoricola sp.]|nr:alpha/beta hydrolase fold protein [Marmoricola sp.]
MSVYVSEELFAPVSPGIELCYQTFGSPDGDPLLLVMGLGGPMTWWDPELCTML